MSIPSRIKQLDERTIGHIAAGEVVERPAQVVKELVENSIDAGAKRINIDIERGGFDLMKITDDGSGIHEDDLPLSLDRHATSKLRSEEDLASIGTLGFRGEALASIGMVSKLGISSRPPNSEGRKIVMDNGDREELSLPELLKELVSRFHIFSLISPLGLLSKEDQQPRQVKLSMLL